MMIKMMRTILMMIFTIITLRALQEKRVLHERSERGVSGDGGVSPSLLCGVSIDYWWDAFEMYLVKLQIGNNNINININNINNNNNNNNKGGSSNDRGGGGSWLTDQSGWMSGWKDKDQEDYVSFDDNDDDNNDDDPDDELG